MRKQDRGGLVGLFETGDEVVGIAGVASHDPPNEDGVIAAWDEENKAQCEVLINRRMKADAQVFPYTQE